MYSERVSDSPLATQSAYPPLEVVHRAFELPHPVVFVDELDRVTDRAVHGALALRVAERCLRPLAREAGPSLNTLLTVAELFGASLEATARQLVNLDIWPCAFVFWEDGFRKSERIPKGQAMIPILEHFGEPEPELRVSRPYQSRAFGLYVPSNKSIQRSSLVATCCEAEPFTQGFEVFEFERNRPETLYCENAYVPYGVYFHC